MGGRFKDEEHLLRVAGLAVVGLLAFLLARGLLIPEGFGVYGHFRAGAIHDNTLRPVSYAGQADCIACHDDAHRARAAGKHKGVACEACHGPLARHAANPELKPERPDGRATCLVCHLANVAKPAGFPQIDPNDHAGPGPCVECHSAHQPAEPTEAEP